MVPEQVHQREDDRKEEGETQQEERVGQGVATGVLADDREMCGGCFLALRVDECSDQQDRWRNDSDRTQQRVGGSESRPRGDWTQAPFLDGIRSLCPVLLGMQAEGRRAESVPPTA